MYAIRSEMQCGSSGLGRIRAEWQLRKGWGAKRAAGLRSKGRTLTAPNVVTKLAPMSRGPFEPSAR